MNHIGNIKGIDGASVPAVDVIIGGSPCQDLSVAGQGAGPCLWSSEIEPLPMAVTWHRFNGKERDEQQRNMF